MELKDIVNEENGILSVIRAWKGDGLSEREYRGSAGLSQSSLKLFMESPMTYKDSIAYPKKPTAEMEFGTCFHAMLLDEDPSVTFVEMPDFGDQRNKDNKEQAQRWMHENAGVIWLDSKVKEGQMTDMQRLRNMKEALISHPQLRFFFNETSVMMREQVLYAEINTVKGSILLKGKIDMAGGGIVIDYKTTDDASKQKFSRTIRDNGYDIQQVQYALLCLANGIPVNQSLIAGIEKRPKSDTSGSPMHNIGIYEIDVTKKYKYSDSSPVKEWSRAVCEFCEHKEQDLWPSYNNDSVERIDL